MRAKLLALLLTCLILFTQTNSYAVGGINHMLIAKETIAKMKTLPETVRDETDALLVGSNYPDSGYVSGTHYGEDSHWEKFITTFAAHLKETYPNPIESNPKLVAFLLGVSTHSVSDKLWHWTFIPLLALQDFKGDKEKAHTAADTGLDLIGLIDNNQWSNRPTKWWVPVDDLVQVYQRMGKAFSRDEIIYGNAVYSLAGIGQRAIALMAAPIYRLQMPWGEKAYMNKLTPGSIPNMVTSSVLHNELLMWRLRTLGSDVKEVSEKQTLRDEHPNIYLQWAKALIDSGIVSLNVQETDGGVIIEEPELDSIVWQQQIHNLFLLNFKKDH